MKSKIQVTADNGERDELFEELRTTMLRTGWCSHQIEHLALLFGLDALRVFLYAMPERAQRPEDHHPCLKQQHCIAYNAAPPELYQTTHARDCPGSTCYTVKTPYRDLVRVIQSGGVPLLSIHENSTDGISLRVHKRQFRSDYATVSHVWADGLGNPRENALPSCQVKRLRSLLDHDTAYTRKTWAKHVDTAIFGCPRSKLFWMDTLCIPTQDSLLRSQCVNAMSSIYAGSSRVFILDKELMNTRTNLADISQCLIYIACSVWICRSWTLQEAMLPEECLFQFKDGIFQPSLLIDRDECISSNVIKENTLRILSPDGDLSPFNECHFWKIWNSLAGRSTTQAEDLYIVLASCLGFKLRQFQAFSTLEEKIQRIVFSFRDLPLSLFFNTGPRLHSASNHHNRWVPTQVSKDPLCDGCCRFVFPYFRTEPRYPDQAIYLELQPCNEALIFLINEIISMPTVYTIHTGNRNYLIEPVIQEGDAFQTTGYAATCLFISHDRTYGIEPTRGACFFVSPSQAADIVNHEQPIFEMVYFNPVRLKVMDDQESEDGGDRECFSAHVIENTRSFRVRFGEYPWWFALM